MALKKWVVRCVFLFFIGIWSAKAQNQVFIDFEGPSEKWYPVTHADQATYMVDVLRPQFTKGIHGKALDLTSNAVLRKPLALDSLDTPDYSGKKDLTVQVWVRTLKGAKQGTPIIGNRTLDKSDEAGWQMGTGKNGAWKVVLSDGKNSYSYQPTPERLAVNDGNWHHLAFSINREKEEVWFYFDGIQVATYNIPGFGSLQSQHATVIGGADQYAEWGSERQWTAFNGIIDEVRIDNEYRDANYFRNEVGLVQSVCEIEAFNGTLRTMVWNIWHGGRRYGQEVGVDRVIETIKSARPDVVALIETYGSGEKIADALGYHFYLISSNLSIMSKFPIKETVKAFKPFNFGGAIIDLGNGKELAFLDTWLDYRPNYWKKVWDESASIKELIDGEKKTRHKEVVAILKEIKPVLKRSTDVPVIMLGDFNSGSHLDWTERTKEVHKGLTIEWPVSKAMIDAGFKDSYRELHIDPLLDPGLTWTPRAATSSTKYGLRDRIDYIYYQGGLRAVESKMIEYHPIMFPSDHAGVLTVFEWKEN